MPARCLFVTYNLWNTVRWPERLPALRAFLARFRPDVLCVQELREALQRFLDEELSGHVRVRDGFAGWTVEGNIWWSGILFEEVEHGAEDVGMLEEHRRLFWVRLRQRIGGGTLLVATAHFTYSGMEPERGTGVSPRIEQARRTIEALRRIERGGEPVFFMGDLNDAHNPVRALHEAGYIGCFTRLGLQSPATAASLPTIGSDPGEGPKAAETIDWITTNRLARPVLALVPDFLHEGLPPSDHKAVAAVYEF